jgi:hypothetical protein
MFWSFSEEVHHGLQMQMMFTITNHPTPMSMLKLDIMTNGNKCSLLQMFSFAMLEV